MHTDVKNVVVCGGNKGIGLGITERFLQDGHNVVVGTIDQNYDETVIQLKEQYPTQIVHFVQCDVSNVASIKSFYKSAYERMGSIDVSVQNAGVIRISKLEEVTEKDWDITLDVNTKGMFFCCKEAIYYMKLAGQGGRLINTASGQAREGFIYTPHYAASKFGAMGLTQSLAKEVAADHITVNSICPGIIHTDMWDYNDKVWGELMGDFKPGELMASWVENIPMKRAGSVKEVAGLVAFLAGPDAAYITGQAINVDGGLIMS
ncbi:SDR family oxidoreductase [Marinomonas balearica]|uniref:Meso-butanediol dehydrogenase/(S,S)-butanediol dehydrogenase/diacetyl reductase n=1 Tax=Marinomonas balearica TaxID=491947 RepID=A0A4V3CH11_9GAMM|nr:SDR family oxidoreductase [Marinomonas balearica]TDO99762.1 meso-butanediol dehydrogenase/(S,S)-butanediol dehydrogenase/diacetyl reductase [Marinomonas balearica]